VDAGILAAERPAGSFCRRLFLGETLESGQA
jgi:hypothetical protein